MQKNSRIGFLTRVDYGSRDVAYNIVYGMISSLLVLFYIDHAGTAASLRSPALRHQAPEPSRAPPTFWLSSSCRRQGTLQTVTSSAMSFYCKYIYHNDSWIFITMLRGIDCDNRHYNRSQLHLFDRRSGNPAAVGD